MIKNALAVLFILLLCDCKEADKSDTYFFSNYLKSNFNTGIPEGKHKFILSSSNGCKGCNAKLLLHALERKNTRNTTYIFPSEVEDKVVDINHYQNIWIDKIDRVNKLKFHGGNSCIIYTHAAGIDSIILINVETEDSILNSIDTN